VGQPDLLINCTSAGMNPEDTPPINLSQLDSQTLVAEVIIKPSITCTLKKAKEVGCNIHEGIHMLQGQLDLMINYMQGIDTTPANAKI